MASCGELTAPAVPGRWGNDRSVRKSADKPVRSPARYPGQRRGGWQEGWEPTPGL